MTVIDSANHTFIVDYKTMSPRYDLLIVLSESKQEERYMRKIGKYVVVVLVNQVMKYSKRYHELKWAKKAFYKADQEYTLKYYNKVNTMRAKLDKR